MTTNLTLASHFKLYTPLDRACYAASLALVAGIDEDLTSGRRHYRNRAGTLLTTLDEIVRAILADDLVTGEASKVGEMTAEDHRRIRRDVYREHQRRRRNAYRQRGLPTDTLKQTYAFIEAYQSQYLLPPTGREIGEAFGITRAAAFQRLDRMQELGWIKRKRRQQQSIVLMGLASNPPA